MGFMLRTTIRVPILYLEQNYQKIESYQKSIIRKKPKKNVLLKRSRTSTQWNKIDSNTNCAKKQ